MASKHKSFELNRYSMFIVLVVVFIAASLLSPNFLSANNLFNVLRQVAVITILAYGAMTLIIGGMIDLRQRRDGLRGRLVRDGLQVQRQHDPRDSDGNRGGRGLQPGQRVPGGDVEDTGIHRDAGHDVDDRGAVLEITQGQNVLQLGKYILIGQATSA